MPIEISLLIWVKLLNLGVNIVRTLVSLSVSISHQYMRMNRRFFILKWCITLKTGKAHSIDALFTKTLCTWVMMDCVSYIVFDKGCGSSVADQRKRKPQSLFRCIKKNLPRIQIFIAGSPWFVKVLLYFTLGELFKPADILSASRLCSGARWNWTGLRKINERARKHYFSVYICFVDNICWEILLGMIIFLIWQIYESNTHFKYWRKRILQDQSEVWDREHDNHVLFWEPGFHSR